MATVALTAVTTPDPGPDPGPRAAAWRAPSVTLDRRRRYDAILARAARLEGLFPCTPAEYAQAAGVTAVLEASRR